MTDEQIEELARRGLRDIEKHLACVARLLREMAILKGRPFPPPKP